MRIMIDTRSVRKLFLLPILLLATITTWAQEEETEDTATVSMTPFTGMNYVRLVFHKKELIGGAVTFKAAIRSVQDGKILWQGNVKPVAAINEGGEYLAVTINNLKPVLWTPANPYLYEITLQQLNKGVAKKTMKERAGFRSFERKGGNLYLNGKPIFLRGIAINPPGRGIPTAIETSRAFALDYVRYMKSINVNIIRIPDAEAWYDVCDELGMMVFGGNYSGKVAGGEKVDAQAKVGDETDGGFPSDYNKGVEWYENKKLGAIAHHPSLMVYAMTNETPFAGPRAALWEKFLDYSYKKLKQWDETRVYIANAGYGYGKTGDITDIHRYWGWYYSSPFTFLHIRDEAKINPYPTKHQPITFTECVGNYTGPDGRYNLTPGHKNPSSQLAWTGHERQDLQSQLADYHQSFTFRQATESFRQFRRINPDLSGVFPFTILFYNWNTVTKFDDMNPKPVTDQVKISYQPVLLSWECWTPNVFAGSVIKPIAHIINDDNQFRDLVNSKLIYEIKDKAKQVVFADSISLATVPYYGTSKNEISIKLPAGLVSGHYELTGKIIRDKEIVSQNYYKLFIADQYFTSSALSPVKNVLLYDKQGSTKKALDGLKIKYTEINSFDNISSNAVLIIGENSADATIASNKAAIKKIIADGGRVLSLRQDSIHLQHINSLLLNPVTNNTIDIDDPVYPLSVKSPRNGYYVNAERPDHPVFAGITRDNLRVWSDYTGWNATKQGLPSIKPVTDGFNLENRDDVANTAILANYSSGLQAIALAEQFQGNGSILLCGLDLASRASIDPVATRLLLNLINYTGDNSKHERYPLITSPIVWGEYEMEKGVVTDLYSGFLVNSTPRVAADYLGKGIVVTKDGYQLAGGAVSGFNTRPGIQY
ncbi:MAG TPA: glycoside hydrolase family 2 TIM barrel-domain containing protein, partial [Chitinophagaceae bacterium]|nr:glycoside hydrolase family 2 TIM barrel-domain containing protein [Chitinophagaceae bacterium]